MLHSRFLTFIVLLISLLMLAGCGGGSSMSTDPGTNAPVVKPEGGEKNTASSFVDPTPGDPAPWKWCMVFDYGDPIPGQVYNWATAELVDGGDGFWYMQYRLKQEYLDLGWMFLDAHVYVGASAPNKGNPGSFPYKWDWEGDPGSMMAGVDLKLVDKKGVAWAPTPGVDYYIAIHCSIGIWGITGYDPITGEAIYGLVDDETGWGGYCDKDGVADWDGYWKKWGGYIYTGSRKGFPVFDPVYNKCYRAYHFGPYSYWRVRFEQDDWYPFPGSNDWVGWCVDPRTMYPGQLYCVDAYSSYDPALPAFAASDNWEFISYMINMRNMGAAPFNQDWTDNAWKQKFQDAVWYFKYGTINNDPPASNTGAWMLINDAITNGDNYVPGPGGYYAVILYPVSGYPGGTDQFQMNIIEVDP